MSGFMQTINRTYYQHEGFELTFEAIEESISIEQTDKGYIIKYLVRDDNCMSPREWGNLGKMVCFHSSYNLGDEHNFDNPTRFLFELAYELSLEELEKFSLDDEQNQEKLLEIIVKKAVLLPLYLYDHSGITINTTGFSCPWDSGQVGYIYVSHKDIIKEYGKLDIDKATKLLESEVSEYDNMLTGDVYGIVSETYNKDKEQIDCDSCFGYFGYNYAIEALKTEI